jgi:Rad3-related DNA helicase
MYSAGLSRDALRDAASAAPAALAPPLKSLQRAWGAAAKGQSAPYAAHAEVPARLVKAARNACDAIAAHAAAEPDGLDARVSEFGFELMRFVRLAETFGSHSIFDVAMERGPRHSVLGIRNVVPAPFLAPRFAAAHASVLFSATLSPPRFYADTLGLPEDAAWLDVDAPFAAAQLEVNVVADVCTRFARRAQSAPAIARIIAAQFARRPGNYLAFFSSFDYLRMVLDALRAAHPEVPAWEQARRMSDAEKDAFLARFVEGGAGVGFAVLGGSFAEGVDLPGDRLVGAFVATLGLPQLNPVNEEFRRALHESFGAGFEYAYLYPGLRKVVQAAGRVIRTPSDTGTLYLIDERFARADVRELLPSWWRPRRTMAAAAGAA